MDGNLHRRNEQAAERQRAILEERKKKWMNERDMEANPKLNPKSSSSSAPSLAAFGENDTTDEFISKLTTKLTRNIREEVQHIMATSTHTDEVRSVLNEKMDQYLQGELGTHKCKLCHQLMISPNNTPILLFPCGHTFCKQCLGKRSATCPFCRSEIQSSAVNQSLKELIDQFAKQRAMVGSESGLYSFEDIFSPSTPSQSIARRSANGTDSNDRQASHYSAQLRNCVVRKDILTNDYRDASNESAQLDKRKAALMKASQILLGERRDVDERMRLLHEELALIDKHIADQDAKIAEVVRRKQGAEEQMALTGDTLKSLEAEIEKLEILAGSGGSGGGGRSMMGTLPFPNEERRR